MEIADTFPHASFGGIEFPYSGVDVNGSLDHFVHKYIHRPGGEVEELGRHLYEVNFECQFDTGSRLWRNLYPQRLAELVSLCETGKTYPLVIPTRGVRAMNAKATKWTQAFTAKVRSGEKIRFSFIEDGSDQFSAFQIVQFQALSLGGYAGKLTDAAIAIGEPSIFDKILDALGRFELALINAENKVARVLGAINAVIGACDAVLGLATLSNPTHWLAIELVLGLYNLALTLAADISGASRIVDKWFVGRAMSIVEVSVGIHGTPDHVDDLLSLNDFNDLVRIPAGTVVNYYAN